MAVFAQQRVDLVCVHQSAEEVRNVAVDVPRCVVLQPAGVALEQQRRGAHLLDLLGDRAFPVGHEPAGQPFQLTVDDEPGAGLEDECRLTDHARVLVHLDSSAAAEDHDLNVRPVARLQRAHGVEAEAPVLAAQQRGAGAEQGAVEIYVDAAHRSCILP